MLPVNLFKGQVNICIFEKNPGQIVFPVLIQQVGSVQNLTQNKCITKLSLYIYFQPFLERMH